MMQVRVPVNGARRRSPMVLNSTGADPVWCKAGEDASQPSHKPLVSSRRQRNCERAGGNK